MSRRVNLKEFSRKSAEPPTRYFIRPSSYCCATADPHYSEISHERMAYLPGSLSTVRVCSAPVLERSGQCSQISNTTPMLPARDVGVTQSFSRSLFPIFYVTLDALPNNAQQCPTISTSPHVSGLYPPQLMCQVFWFITADPPCRTPTLLFNHRTPDISIPPPSR